MSSWEHASVGKHQIWFEIHHCCAIGDIDKLQSKASGGLVLNKTPYACSAAAAKCVLAACYMHMSSVMHIMTHILKCGAKHLLSRFPEVLQVTLGQVAEDVHQNNWKSCHHKG